MIAFFAGAYLELFDPAYAYDHFLELASASIIFSFLLSSFLFIKAKLNRNVLLAVGGNSGIWIYDFFIGHELNPRIGDFDLKYFCELRPGLIGWCLINFSMAFKQWQTTGSLHIAMILVCAFQALYVFDALFMEVSFNSVLTFAKCAQKCILTTMDITTDGFGFMLVFGDLSWVPFTYCTQARFLVDFSTPQLLSNKLTLAIVIFIKVLGYWIFRSSNSQKNFFRSSSEADKIKSISNSTCILTRIDWKYIKTSTGRKLLVSGWWGVARHVNYLGDLLMALSWCMATGTGSIIPYFYVIYFTILLIHRDLRDDEACHRKYGNDWIKYKKLVPYRIFPGIY